MNLSSYVCSGLSTRKNNRTEKSLQETGEKQVRTKIARSTIRLPAALLKMVIIMRDATL